MSRYDEDVELIEADQRQAHADRICEGVPFCGYCLDDWEESQKEELDKQGYYDWNGRWTT